MRDLAADETVYADLENLPWDSPEGTSYYRIIKVMETSVVGPFLPWILRWNETEIFLASSKANANYWPDDNDLVVALRETKVYSTLTRGRLRMVLEALEDHLRGPWNEHQHCPRGQLTIEHIMPQGWPEHWGNDVQDATASIRRDQLVQTLGNLTLVNNRLNPALSHRPWTDQDALNRGLGNKWKHHLLSEYSTLNSTPK